MRNLKTWHKRFFLARLDESLLRVGDGTFLLVTEGAGKVAATWTMFSTMAILWRQQSLKKITLNQYDTRCKKMFYLTGGGGMCRKYCKSSVCDPASAHVIWGPASSSEIVLSKSRGPASLLPVSQYGSEEVEEASSASSLAKSGKLLKIKIKISFCKLKKVNLMDKSFAWNAQKMTI